MAARLVQQRGWDTMRFAVETVDASDPIPRVLWEQHLALSASPEDTEFVRLEAERQLKYFNGGGDGQQGNRGGAGSDVIEPARDAPAGNVLELSSFQRAEPGVPAEIAGDGPAPTAGRERPPGGVPSARPVPGDDGAELVRGVGDGQAEPAGVAPPSASVTLLRPEMITVAQLLAQLAASCEAAGDQAPPFVVVAIFNQDNTMQNFVKAPPPLLAMAGAHFSSMAVGMSFVPAAAGKPA